MKNDKALLGLIGGIAAGAILGILFAPDKGTATRKKIKNKSADYADDLKVKFDSAIDTVSKKYDELKAESQDLYAQGKAKFDTTTKDVVNEIQKEVQNFKA